jgi:dGTP triphosphohydrolase
LDWIKSKIITPLVLESEETMLKEKEGRRYVRGVYNLWKNNSDTMLKRFGLMPEIDISFGKGYSSERKFCDFICALTDNEIIKIYRTFYGPEQ